MGLEVIVTDWEALGMGLEAIATCWNGTGSLDAVYSLDAVSVCCESLLMCCIIMKVTCWDCVGGHTNMLGGHIYEVECHITCLEGGGIDKESSIKGRAEKFLKHSDESPILSPAMIRTSEQYMVKVLKRHCDH